MVAPLAWLVFGLYQQTPDSGLMLDNRLWWYPNIEPTLRQRLVGSQSTQYTDPMLGQRRTKTRDKIATAYYSK